MDGEHANDPRRAVAREEVRRRLPSGIRLRHGRNCATAGGGQCDCSPAFEAVVNLRDGRRLRKSFRNLGEAIVWREDKRVDRRKRVVIAPTTVTFHEYAEQWLARMRDGRHLTRDEAVYKPSTQRAYAKHIKRIYPMIGSLRLSSIELLDLEDARDQLVGKGLSASSLRNTFDPVRKIFARAVRERLIAVNPTLDLKMKAKDGRRDWVDRPERVARALQALQERERGPWTLAFYAGLRAGEIQALRWSDVDFDRGVIHVRRSWDRKAGPIAPKSKAGVRKVPMATPVRIAIQHAAANAPDLAHPDELVFGRAPDQAFAPRRSTGERSRRGRKGAWSTSGRRMGSSRPVSMTPVTTASRTGGACGTSDGCTRRPGTQTFARASAICMSRRTGMLRMRRGLMPTSGPSDRLLGDPPRVVRANGADEH
jgi:integrase